MSLKVAWSLLSLLTWFRSKYQQFTGDSKFWSFLRSEEKQNYPRFQSCPNQLGEVTKAKQEPQQMGTVALLPNLGIAHWATREPAHQPSRLWWRKASNSLGLEEKTWTKNTSQTHTPDKGHGTLAHTVLRQAFSFQHPLKKVVDIYIKIYWLLSHRQTVVCHCLQSLLWTSSLLLEKRFG